LQNEIRAEFVLAKAPKKSPASKAMVAKLDQHAQPTTQKRCLTTPERPLRPARKSPNIGTAIGAGRHCLSTACKDFTVPYAFARKVYAQANLDSIFLGICINR
jgi:hypothetical protein